MNPQPPGVAVRLHHLGLSREVTLFVLHVALADFRLEVARKFDPVRRVDVDHLHLARQVLAPGQRRHHLKAVAQDQPVRPVHIVLIELDRFVVLLLRVGEHRPVYILPRGDFQNGLRADALVDVQRHRIHRERPGFAFARPFEPRLVLSQRLGQRPRFGLIQWPPRGLGQQLGQLVGGARGIKAQHRRKPRTVAVLGLRQQRNVALGRDLGRRVVLPGGLGMAVVCDGRPWVFAAGAALLLPGCHGFSLSF